MKNLLKKLFSTATNKHGEFISPSIIRDEIEKSLENDLNSWYPASLDKKYGGFITNLNETFEPVGAQQKSLIHQSRHLWTVSRACLRYPDHSMYRECADNGFKFLSDNFWDDRSNSFFTKSERNGTRIQTEDLKSAYSQSFAIYGMVAYYTVSKNPKALKLATDTFHWLETNMYDANYKGYFSYTDKNNNVTERPVWSAVLDGKCYKGINTMLHLLEAYTELYKVWPNPLLHTRLTELLDLIQDKIFQPEGYLHNYFERDWRPVKIQHPTKSTVKKFNHLDHISFGHDVEAAFLMREAAIVLSYSQLDKTLNIIKQLVDHTIKYGFDNWKGGVFAKGYYFKKRKKLTVMDKSKSWWIQAEALHAFLLLATLYPNEKRKYFSTFNKQWAYIKKHLIDFENGGWYESGLDRSPGKSKNLKSHEWKTTYHTYRAMENSVDLLDKQSDCVSG